MTEMKVEVVATFPPGFFLENIGGSTRNGTYITCVNRQELYWLPPYSADGPQVSPHLVETLSRDQWVMGIVAAPQNSNVYYVVSSDFLGLADNKTYLRIFNTADPSLGARTQIIMEFPPKTRLLNGLCALSGSVLLAADSFSSCIWRIDLELSKFPPKAAKAEVWYSHHTMAAELALPDFQPGTNGLKYSAKTGYVYYTSTQKQLFCRVRVDPDTLAVADEAEVLAKGWQWDDLIMDDRDGKTPYAYVTTHRDNAIVKVRLEPDRSIPVEESIVVVLQDTNSLTCIGPTAGLWEDDNIGKSALFLTDGGIKNPPKDGRVRCAKVIRVEFKDE